MSAEKKQEVRIRLTIDEYEKAERLATERRKYWEDRGQAQTNWAPNQETGALGEVGAHKWLVASGLVVDPAYEDLERQAEADLIVPGGSGRIDVKTYHLGLGDAFRINAKQVASLSAKADILLWCMETHEDSGFTADRNSCVVTILGWSRSDELGSTPERNQDGTEYTYRSPTTVHPTDDLLDLLRQ